MTSLLVQIYTHTYIHTYYIYNRYMVYIFSIPHVCIPQGLKVHDQNWLLLDGLRCALQICSPTDKEVHLKLFKRAYASLSSQVYQSTCTIYLSTYISIYFFAVICTFVICMLVYMHARNRYTYQ